MRRLPSGQPVWDLEFDEKGRLTTPAEETFQQEVADEQVDDLFMFSHGWGTSEHHARNLYDDMFPRIASAGDGTAEVGRTGFAGIYWPSLWFPDSEATPAQGTGSAQAGGTAVVDLSAGTAALSGTEIAHSLAPGFADPDDRQKMMEIGRLIDEGQAAIGKGEPDQQLTQRLEDIHQLLQSLAQLAATAATEDSGETSLLLSKEPAADYQATAEAFGSAPAGSSTQSARDWFARAINGAKDVLRVFSYQTMKTRAGDIGQHGLGPLLARLHSRSSSTRVHLIGHSFGARLVSFALTGVGAPAESPISSLLLIQGAFSHWAFAQAQNNPFKHAGALNGFENRVHGPLVATFTQYDWAVGVWYPKASFLARQDTQADEAGRWEGMGADGYQAVQPLAERSMPAGGGKDYAFAPRNFYRVNADAVINSVAGQPFAGAHSDIRKPAVAELAVAAAAAHE